MLSRDEVAKPFRIKAIFLAGSDAKLQKEKSPSQTCSEHIVFPTRNFQKLDGRSKLTVKLTLRLFFLLCIQKTTQLPTGNKQHLLS